MVPNWTGFTADALASAKNNPAIACMIAVDADDLALVASPAVVVTPVIDALHYFEFRAGDIISGL